MLKRSIAILTAIVLSVTSIPLPVLATNIESTVSMTETKQEEMNKVTEVSTVPTEDKYELPNEEVKVEDLPKVEEDKVKDVEVSNDELQPNVKEEIKNPILSLSKIGQGQVQLVRKAGNLEVKDKTEKVEITKEENLVNLYIKPDELNVIDYIKVDGKPLNVNFEALLEYTHTFSMKEDTSIEIGFALKTTTPTTTQIEVDKTFAGEDLKEYAVDGFTAIKKIEGTISPLSIRFADGRVELLSTFIKTVDGKPDQAAYCIQRSKQFTGKSAYVKALWSGNPSLSGPIFSEISYVINNGLNKFGGSPKAFPSTGNPLLDYYITQVRIWEVISDYQYKVAWYPFDANLVNGLPEGVELIPTLGDEINGKIVLEALAVYRANTQGGALLEYTGGTGYGDKKAELSYRVENAAHGTYLYNWYDASINNYWVTSNWISINKSRDDIIINKNDYIIKIDKTEIPKSKAFLVWDSSGTRFYLKMGFTTAMEYGIGEHPVSISKIIGSTERVFTYFYLSEDNKYQNITTEDKFTYENTLVDIDLQLTMGRIKITKTSSLGNLANVSPQYKLQGAVFRIYFDKACQYPISDIKIDADGIGYSGNLVIGNTYYVKEITPAPGHALDPTVHEVITGETVTLYEMTVQNKALMDPVIVAVAKVDAQTNKNEGQGNGKLEGAEFTIKYYKNDYDTAEQLKGVQHERKWTIRTDKDGYARLRDDYLVGKDNSPFYLNEEKTVSLPLGTVSIQETKAPEGYLINNTVYVEKIVHNKTTNVAEFNEKIVKDNVLELNLIKKDSVTKKVLPGAKFKHTRPNGQTELLTTNAEGKLQFKGLEYGDHAVVEVEAPVGYYLNTQVITFNVATDNKITFTSTPTESTTNGTYSTTIDNIGNPQVIIEEKPVDFKLTIHKTNDEALKLAGAEFTIYEDEACTKAIEAQITNTDGILSFSEKLAVATNYYLKETKAPEGYKIPKKQDGTDIIYKILANYNSSTNEFVLTLNDEVITTNTNTIKVTNTLDNKEVELTVINKIQHLLPKTGSMMMIPIVGAGCICMVGSILFDKKKKGKKED